MTFANSLKINAEQRKILDMVFVDGLTYGLIGDRLGFTERAIKYKMSKLLDLI